MCGRATLTNGDINDLLRELDAEVAPDAARAFAPRYNIAPSDLHWIVESTGNQRVLVPAAWGYLASGRPLVNVRGEQVGSGRGFRQAFQSRRCVMVTDGFFEWDRKRTPFWYHRPTGGLVLLGALYQQPPADPSHDQPAAAQTVQRFTVLTTQPNHLVAQVHNRMPVIIPPERLDDWLAGEPTKAAGLIAPAADDFLIATPVSRRVNSVKNDDPTCLTPTTDSPAPALATPRQGSLF